MGVWIEIFRPTHNIICRSVTPLVGVWIEIFLLVTSMNTASVTPLVGVWIEIYKIDYVRCSGFSHSPCGSVD